MRIRRLVETRGARLLFVVGAVFLAYLLGMIPEGDVEMDPPPAGSFVWDKDAYWQQLEKRFRAVRNRPCGQVDGEVASTLATLHERLDGKGCKPPVHGSPFWETFERELFDAAVKMAACPDVLARHGGTVDGLRKRIKEATVEWNLENRDARERLYRLLYGSRAALEEAILASGATPDEEPVQWEGNRQTPSVMVHGVEIHSGDLLLSRGTAPTSALIARGNDFPGNFSHVAIAHVAPLPGPSPPDPLSRQRERGSENGEGVERVSIVESHIEGGVAVADVETYLADAKFRILLLRLRSKHPALQRDPLAPHRAAERALARARAGHVAYDFEMDFNDTEKLFCSEVASEGYEGEGITLWMNLSRISNPTVTRWMSNFGVRHFVTQAPSDLEYDPQLEVVHEWRSVEGLLADHIDNAVVDAMVATAPEGQSLPYNRWLLPFARLAKGVSAVMVLAGGTGPVPEGMSATAALRNTWYSNRHAAIKARVVRNAAAFKATYGYWPPYWKLVAMATNASLY